VGQAVARQSRREWVDLPTLRALGMSSRDMRSAALLRGAVIGVAAAVAAAVVAVALSPLGPIGVGRRAETDPGRTLDVLVLATGTVAVLAAVTLATWLPFPRTARSAAGGTLATGRRPSIRGPLPAAAIIASPNRFGAPWDVSVTNLGPALGDSADEAARLLAGRPDVAAAAAIVGTDVEVGGEVIWVQAFRPIGEFEVIGSVITSGRAPVTIDEIALGSVTMDGLGVEIGDRVAARSTVRGGVSGELTIVGATVINDTYEASPGRGGVVAPEWIEAQRRRWRPIRTRPAPAWRRRRGVQRGTRGPLGWDHQPTDPAGSDPQRRADRHAPLPPGCSRRRARGRGSCPRARPVDPSLAWPVGSVEGDGLHPPPGPRGCACHATAIAIGAAVVGVLLGVILGRLGWQLIADQIGVASGPVTPFLGVALTVLGAVVVANLIAIYPAWRAARAPTVQALRVE